MSRINVGDHVYVVAWPDERIIKAGYSARSRWRDFESRGATLLMLIPFATIDAAFQCERSFDEVLAGFGPQAFTNSTDAIPYLGGKGGGYIECYTLNPLMLGAMLAHMRRIVAEQCSTDAQALRPLNARTDGRTDLRTTTHPERSFSTNASPAGGQPEFASPLRKPANRCDHAALAEVAS